MGASRFLVSFLTVLSITGVAILSTAQYGRAVVFAKRAGRSRCTPASVSRIPTVFCGWTSAAVGNQPARRHVWRWTKATGNLASASDEVSSLYRDILQKPDPRGYQYRQAPHLHLDACFVPVLPAVPWRQRDFPPSARSLRGPVVPAGHWPQTFKKALSTTFFSNATGQQDVSTIATAGTGPQGVPGLHGKARSEEQFPGGDSPRNGPACRGSPFGDRLVFPRLGVFPDFVDSLSNFNVREATEIQQLSIPAILEGRDTVIGAETGSGKTLGYVVGLVQNILLQKMIHEKKEDAAVLQKTDLPIPRHHPYAVVIVPTRELALQVVAWARRLCRKTTITAQLMLGTYARWPFGTLAIPTSPDLVVCTPPVLAPFAKGGHTKDLTPFREIQMVAVDEADMLLEGGYRQTMEGIFTAFRRADRQCTAKGLRRTQYIFTAATIPDRGPKSVRKIISRLCPKATFFCTDNLHQHRQLLEQEFVEVSSLAPDEERIHLLLRRLKDLGGHEKIMVFCNTAQTARRVFEALEKELPAARPKLFSSEMDQKDRSFNLGVFARGKSKILVCTDAASRGLDIAGVTLVIQYDFALSAITHLHRVGRVARGGQPGKALNFFLDSQKVLVGVIRKAAEDPVSTSVADAFSRKRSFRKKMRDNQSLDGQREGTSETVGSPSTLHQGQGVCGNRKAEEQSTSDQFFAETSPDAAC
ncbi:DEAD/DEAH box helicase domain-containing protein [Besnoitia besnoiti]|uniref:ATP-dependent RNA helicase n=1 Tax=Besnoitia besnoiti TaxID=94643 RepID=A0A2A9M1Y6_BESBE|nr:DEAD/DEAH box helicase domain-containing protein [Besnoitia besnoiti]PFH31979.1 DEAD/DEAH box helicase domain-containing protein [Besnoitia besnoiti]